MLRSVMSAGIWLLTAGGKRVYTLDVGKKTRKENEP